MSRLFADKLHISYGSQPIVENLDLAIPDGKVTALVGANGSGKSTILKTMARLMKAKKGTVYLDGKSISQMQTKEVAKQLAILPQNPVAPEGLTVRELVAYGRFPHQKGLGTLSKEDKAMIEWALQVTKMEELAERQIESMSGGQRQRAWIAMALAQGTDILFLDEPTTYLDMAHQLEVLKLLEQLNREEGKTIVMVVHDLNHAALYAEHIVAIKRGKIVQAGDPAKVVTKGMLQEVFGIEADVIPCPRTGAPLCLPYALVEEAGSSVVPLNAKTERALQPQSGRLERVQSL
ncbi:iron-dicitrate ABC transporter ATP-binding protein [Xylanibacillus composti]|uniref:Iron-dicitrate ABC transporter ATP-binding protein n=1 Tax=Xylanibacillus composti TaxID=1572762 RepID=A0A8J4H7Y7_9BACL|nr:ABC transporter ATP-binding protein [Xylanibacillus composti]GIQ70523.1 iron-dicitrate ABC transporter ATP-binding protein [Xylanibacillus composti]